MPHFIPSKMGNAKVTLSIEMTIFSFNATGLLWLRVTSEEDMAIVQMRDDE